MTELSGTLDGIGLAPLVGFLAGLGKSGRLAVNEGPMGGEVFLEDGQVIGAMFDNERGLPALDAIGLALGRGRFAFAEGDAGSTDRNLTLTPVELHQHLEELAHEQARLAAAIPSLSALPRVAVEVLDGEDELRLDRDTLRLLLALDGRRSVADLARERGLLRTLKQLARLAQLHLARIEPSHAVTTPPSTPVSGGLGEWRRAAARAAEESARPEPRPAPQEQPAQTEEEADRSAPTPSSRPGSTWSRWHRGGQSSSS